MKVKGRMSDSKETNLTLQNRLVTLKGLLNNLEKISDSQEKLKFLQNYPTVAQQLSQLPNLRGLLQHYNSEEQLAILSVLAIGQGTRIFRDLNSIDNQADQLGRLIQTLLDLETHYDTIGGIIGYHVMVLRLIVEKQQPNSALSSHVRFHHPKGLDLTQDTLEVRQAVRWGIEAIQYVAEIYPVGGAGDRLNLHDDKTGEALPAADLLFGGRTLLEGLVRDLQAREYLHYKILHTQNETPIALMTSHEKNNHTQILYICEQHQWFGRSPNNFLFFTQPLVPVVTINGDWAMQDSMQLMVKPGGHGVIWKLARDNGILDKLTNKGYHHALVRQINNPVAGTDHGLCAHIGWGYHHGKAFGFASCPRCLNTAEGMDILIESEKEDGVDYCITNIEYTEFEHRGVSDEPETSASPYSRFPANTNILVVDLSVVKETVAQCPIPGMLINMKTKVHDVGNGSGSETIPAGRLESTMQNLADYIVDRYPEKLDPITPNDLRTYVTYNERSKTISAAKKAYISGESSVDTPEGCFYEILHNHRELLTKNCHMKVPSLGTLERYLEVGPPFVVFYNPALGPLYQVIGQKIRNGSLAEGSELQLEISELDIQNLHLSGSLLIEADTPLGKKDANGIIRYGEETGKCVLHNVTVKNKGIDRDKKNIYWKNNITRHEAFRIVLRGNAEFYADDVEFLGQLDIEVPDGHRMIATQHQGKIHYQLEKITSPTWYWKYSFDNEDRVNLTK